MNGELPAPYDLLFSSEAWSEIGRMPAGDFARLRDALDPQRNRLTTGILILDGYRVVMVVEPDHLRALVVRIEPI